MSIQPTTFATLTSLEAPEYVQEMAEPDTQRFANNIIPCQNGMGISANATDGVTKFTSSYQYNVEINDYGLPVNAQSYINPDFTQKFIHTYVDAGKPHKVNFGRILHLDKSKWISDMFVSEAETTQLQNTSLTPFQPVGLSKMVSTGPSSVLSLIKKVNLQIGGKNYVCDEVYRKGLLMQRQIPSEVQEKCFPRSLWWYDNVFKFDMRYVNVDQYGNVTNAICKGTADANKYDVTLFPEGVDGEAGSIAGLADYQTQLNTPGWALLNLAKYAEGSERNDSICVKTDGVTYSNRSTGKAVGSLIEKQYNKLGWFLSKEAGGPIEFRQQIEVQIPIQMLMPMFNQEYFLTPALSGTTKSASFTIYFHVDRPIAQLFGAPFWQTGLGDTLIARNTSLRANVQSGVALFVPTYTIFTNSSLNMGTMISQVAAAEIMGKPSIRTAFQDVERVPYIPTGGSNIGAQQYNIESAHVSCNYLDIGPQIMDEGISGQSSNSIYGLHTPYTNAQLCYINNYKIGYNPVIYALSNFNVFIGSTSKKLFSNDATSIEQLYHETLRAFNANAQFQTPMAMTMMEWALYGQTIRVSLQGWNAQSNINVINDGYDSQNTKLGVKYTPYLYTLGSRFDQGNDYALQCVPELGTQPSKNQSDGQIQVEAFITYDMFQKLEPNKPNPVVWTENLE